MFLFTIGVSSQEIETDTLHQKVTEIETISINEKDFEKIEYSFALKKEINYELGAVNPNYDYEMGLRFDNHLKKNARINSVTLFLQKTKKEYQLTNLEINIYKIDSITNKPAQRLNKNQILYTPTTRKSNNVTVNLEKYKIPFPEEGVVVTVKWLPTKANDNSVGPAIRFTNYSKQLTYTRYNNDDKKWGTIPNFSKKQDLYTNVMIGLNVYIKKRKDE